MAGHALTTVVLDPAPGVIAQHWSAAEVRLLTRVLNENIAGGNTVDGGSP